MSADIAPPAVDAQQASTRVLIHTSIFPLLSASSQARSSELSSLLSSLASKEVVEGGGGRRVFQSLPRHLRRRAQSHNLHRLPYRLRAAAQREIESGMMASSSTASATSATALTNHRRKRRRPVNIVAQHAHRQTKHTWLETHIWHAKRMHMLNAWGYRLARTTTDKGWRALYKAGLHLCTVCDVSYVSCVSVTGRENKIAEMMQRMGTDAGDGGVLNELYRGGQRQGELLLHHMGTHPHGLIAATQFLWRPKQSVSSSDERRELWLWLHAAVFDEALTALRATAAQAECAVDELRGELCRFELTGARCQQVLSRVLQSLPVDGADGASAAGGNATWRLLCEAGLRSSSSLPSSVVLGVTAAHPGTLKGKQRIKQPFSVTPTSSSATPAPSSLSSSSILPSSSASSAQLVETLMRWPSDACRSALWDRDVRQRLTATTAWGQKKAKFAAILNKKNAQQQQQTEEQPQPAAHDSTTAQQPPPSNPPIKQPSTRRPKPVQSLFDDLTTPLHCLLVQRPSPSPSTSQQHARGLFSGWDVIVPAGYGMPVWRALVYAGARVEGLEERRRRLSEAGAACFPVDYCDCAAGWMWERWVGEAEKAAWLRHPPNKRVNWQRTGVASPYQPNWAGLIGKERAVGVAVMEEGERRKVDGTAKGWEAVKGSEAVTEQKDGSVEESETPRKRTKPGEETQMEAVTEAAAMDEDVKGEKEEEAGEDEETEAANEALVLQEEAHSMQADIPTTQPDDSLAHYSPTPYLLPYYVLREWRQHITPHSSSVTSPSSSPYAVFASDAFSSALLSVSITPIARGTVDYNALICLPTTAQLTAIITHQPLVHLTDLDHCTADGQWVGVDERLHAGNEAKGDGGVKGVQGTYECVGYVTSGLFSYLHGQGEGIGCVSARGAAASFELSWQAGKRSDTCIVLVRNVTSRTYRPAYMRLR